MTYKEALRIAQAFSKADAERALATTEDLVLRIVAGWRVHEPDAFFEILDAAGLPAIARIEIQIKGTYVERVRAALTDWADLRDVAQRTDVPFRSVQRVLLSNKKRRGWIVEKKRRREGQPGFLHRIVQSV